MPTPTKQPKTAKQTASVKPANHQPATGPAAEPVRKREFNRTQGLIIDAVSEMLIHGSHPENMRSLIAATANHYARRVFARLTDKPEKLERAVRNECEGLEPDWAFDLETAARLNKQAPEPERQTPADVSAKIRESVREDVVDHFEGFISQATPEELWILKEVFTTWESFHRTPACGDHGVPLALGFQFAIGNQEGMIKVPWDMVKTVEKYVSALIAVEGKVTA